jgi:hypothetical protein
MRSIQETQQPGGAKTSSRVKRITLPTCKCSFHSMSVLVSWKYLQVQCDVQADKVDQHAKNMQTR